jgi:hypothetical protein
VDTEVTEGGKRWGPLVHLSCLVMQKRVRFDISPNLAAINWSRCDEKILS